MTQAIAAHGTKIQRGNGASPEVFTDIAEVINIDGPGMSRDAIEVSTGNNDFRQFIAGMADGGEVSLELNFVPTDATQGAGAGLLKDFVDGVTRNFKIVFPDAGSTTWSFAAIVTKFNPTASFDKQLSASVTLKVTGKPTLA